MQMKDNIPTVTESRASGNRKGHLQMKITILIHYVFYNENRCSPFQYSTIESSSSKFREVFTSCLSNLCVISMLNLWRAT